MITMVLLIAFLFALASAQQLPLLYSSNVTIAIPGQPTGSGNFWFDYANKAYRFSSTVAFGSTSTVLVPAPQDKLSVLYVAAMGTCIFTTDIPWDTLPPPPLSLPPEVCPPVGPAVINGVPTTQYLCKAPNGSQDLIISVYLATSGVVGSLVRTNGTYSADGSSISYSVDFTNPNTDPIPPSVFVPPKECSGH